MELELNNIIKSIEQEIAPVEYLESKSATESRLKETGVIIFKSFFDNKHVVLKCLININDNEDDIIAKAKREYDYLNLFRDCKGIIDVFGIFELRSSDGLFIGSILILDYMPETLNGLINSGKRFNNKEIFSFLVQFDKILKRLHFNKEKTIIHSDIKPSNIGVKYVNKNPVYILFDFDIAFEVNQNSKISFSELLGLTPEYSAPEVLNSINSINDNEISQKIDIYSVGIIALQLALNVKYISQKEKLQLNCNLISKKLQKIICYLIEENPNKRPIQIFSYKNLNNYSFNAKENLIILLLLLLLMMFLIYAII